MPYVRLEADTVFWYAPCDHVAQHRQHAVELGGSILDHPEVVEEAPVAFQLIQRL